MIVKIEIETLDNLLHQIRDRNIIFLRIERKANDFYAEYKLGFNKSDKIIDLLSEIEIFKERYKNGIISHFYLWYNVTFDSIISNTQTVELEEKRASEYSIKNDLDNIKHSLSDKDKDKKIIFTNGKKKVSVTVEEVINLLIYTLNSNKIPVECKMKSEVR